MKPASLLLAALLVSLAGCQDADDPPPEGTTSMPGHSSGMSHDPAMTHSPGMTHPGSANAYSGLTATPYPGLSEAEIESLRTGAGAGLALPAEVNGYPGPKHVLELADDLGLTAEQWNRMQALYNATNEAARDQGQRVLDAYAGLEGAFRNGTIDTASLGPLTDAHAKELGDLRRVHLNAHLDSLEILTPHQVARYGELRGYGDADHGSHSH